MQPGVCRPDMVSSNGARVRALLFLIPIYQIWRYWMLEAIDWAAVIDAFLAASVFGIPIILLVIGLTYEIGRASCRERV